MLTEEDIEQRVKQIADGSTVIIQYWPDTGQWAVARSAHDGQRGGWGMIGKHAMSLGAALSQ